MIVSSDMKLDVLVFAAHPDDAELNIGGTIASLVADGMKVGIIDLTKGELGTRGTPETRAKEVEVATQILGVHYRRNLDLGDSILENSKSNQELLIQQVRFSQPDICLIGAPYDRHPDHGKATRLCVDALFYSGLANIRTQYNSVKQEAWRPTSIYHYMQDRPFEPDLIFDISNTWEIKKQAIKAFSTQFNVENPENESSTYISDPKYFAQIEARARYFGHLAGFEFGEPLKKLNGPIGVKSFGNLI